MSDVVSDTLSEELLAELAGHGSVRRFARGRVLITEGEVSDALYVLIAGQMKVFTIGQRGRELIYNILGPGEFFGEMFLDGGLRSASVKASEDSLCVVIGQEKFRSFMAAYPEFAERLVLKLIGRVRHATRQIKGLGLDGVYERIVVLINQIPPDAQGERVIPAAMTQTEIAALVGATREMVNHVFRDLTRQGFVVKENRKRLRVVRDLPTGS
jgi:CRP/FNR family transcriptional regulator, cyclic AMP receptor protein